MLKVAALTTGRNDPSARFRIRQHIAPLAEEGIDVREYIPLIEKHAGLPSVVSDRASEIFLPSVEAVWHFGKLASRIPGVVGSLSADLIWLNRELFPGRYTFERFLKRPFVLDIDDAVWRARPDGVNTMRRLGEDADIIFAGNRTIAEWFGDYSKHIYIVPTAIDATRFMPRDLKTESKRPYTIGWTGSSGNFDYLYEIESPLKQFLEQSNSRLLVVADNPPNFKLLDPKSVDFIYWNPDIESSALNLMDVGLMPLPDTDWTRGKCAFKMLQYMSAGLPVVVSPVGMNAEVLNQGEIGFGAVNDSDWFETLTWLYKNPSEANTMGANGRQLILKYYSLEIVNKLISTIFKGL